MGNLSNFFPPLSLSKHKESAFLSSRLQFKGERCLKGKPAYELQMDKGVKDGSLSTLGTLFAASAVRFC